MAAKSPDAAPAGLSADTAGQIAPGLLGDLLRGATVLTPNQRAAHALSQAYNRIMRADGLRRWQPADVMPLTTWLNASWRRLLVLGAADRLLLNPVQERALWRGIIAGDAHLLPARRAGSATGSLAGLAADAWSALLLGRGRDRLEECASTSEGRAFIRWVQVLEQRLDRARLLTAAELPRVLAAALTKAPHAASMAPAGLVLVDFDQISPAHAHLLEALRRSGCRVDQIATAAAADQAELHRAADEAAELTACAEWVRQLREQDPAARIAVVVPALGERRPALERVFATALGTAPFDPEPPFEFSLGRPLAETTLAATALALLRWIFEALPLTTISSLLLSPHLTGGGAQALAAAEFDAFELRRRDALEQRDALRPELTLAGMIAALEASTRRTRVLNVLYRLRQLRDTAAESGLTAASLPGTYAAIAGAFRRVLDAAGCAPSETADPAEQQLWQAWESLLDEVATLDAADAGDADQARTPQAALAELTRLAGATLFAPASRDAPIQILGPLEPGAVRFDALWFLGADHLSWPPAAAPAPLLPWRLQSSLGLPGADRAGDSARATALTARLAGSARQVVFSYAAQTADGERQASSLLTPLHLLERAAPPRQPARPPLARTWIADDSSLPAPANEAGLGGGARIFELQAACPFRAFAELRAFSTGLDAPETGMNALERGVLVHRTMELFWDRVADQQVLRNLTAEQRSGILDVAITESLTKARAAADLPWDHAYLATQHKRLHQLLEPWLDLEAARPHFAVLKQETKLELVEIGGLRIRSLRVDRIDETAGGLLILDYKTGPTSPKGWLGERPEQPQLPLYAAIFSAATAAAATAPVAGTAPPSLRQEPLAGVALASLRAGRNVSLNGFSDDDRVLAKTSTMAAVNFAEQVEDWRRILTALAEAAAAGDARVQPLSYPETCRHCGQRILCRLNPATLPEPEDDEDSAREREKAERGHE